MDSSGITRILMYSHDTYGLGHLTRTVRIAGAIRACYENASILILSGSPVASYFALPPAADLVKLPSVVKAGKDQYQSRDLAVSFSRVKKVRRELIRSTAEAFRPHLFMVDNVPLGMKGEVLPTLKYLRSARPSTRIILDLRDILDDPVVIRDSWQRDGVYDVLNEFYDHIFVLGDPQVFDAIDAYQLPREKTSHVGYAAPSPRKAQTSSEAHKTSLRLLLTAGGGGDGFSFLKNTLEALVPAGGFSTETTAVGHRLEVITGPFMGRTERKALDRWADHLQVELREFVFDMPRRMERADLVIAMAGYNTCCEILSHANAALIFPRVTPRVEQLLRAEAFESRGIAAMLDPAATQPESVAEAVRKALADAPRLASAPLPPMRGLDRLAEELKRLHPALTPVRRAESRIPPTTAQRDLPAFSNHLNHKSTMPGDYRPWTGAISLGRSFRP
jgi:predicted glycosyltransferase